MTYFPVLGKDDLDVEQQAVWDKITLGPRGFYCGGPEAKKLPDLYNAWLQFPAFADLLLQMADHIRAQTELTGKMRELVVLTTSQLLGARVEYDFHVPFAKAQGLSDALIAAIGEDRPPAFADEAERIIYEANVQLVRNATLTNTTRDEVVGLIGHRGLMQLMAAITLYVITAYTTNVAGVALAEDFSADPKALRDFYAGKAADGRG